MSLIASHEVRLSLRAVKAAATHLRTALDSRKMPDNERAELSARLIDLQSQSRALASALERAK